MVLQISNNVAIGDEEIQLTAIRAQGSGGQNVNKVSSAIHLRFDIVRSSLPDFYKQKLLNLRDQRITGQGVIVIKAQEFRTQEKNRDAALERLRDLVKSVSVVPSRRWPTKPTKGSQKKRLDGKTRRGKIKVMRKTPEG